VYDQIKTQLDTIAELSDEQVAELQSDVVSQFELVEGEDPTPETVDAMTSLADSLDMIRGELSRRESLAAELAAKAAEAVARVKGQADDAGEEMAMTEDQPMEEETPMEETPAPEAEVEVEAEEEDKEDEDEAMKASAEISEDAPELVTESPVEAEASSEEVAEVATSEEVAELATTEETAAEASTNQEDGSELSTEETEETADLATEVAEGSEASLEQPIDSSIALVEEQEEQAPVTASAEQPFEAPADRQPVVQVTEAPVAITAGADIPGYTAGSTINDMY